MKRLVLGGAWAGLLAAAFAPSPQAQGKGDWSFHRVGTFANYRNASLDETTVSEIVAASADGKTLVYTDSEGGAIGIIDITDPTNPRGAGAVVLDPVPGDDIEYTPTSVDVLRNQYALVGADTSASKTNTDGSLVVIELATGQRVADIDLGGQPDSVKVSPDHRFVAIAIENERDEALCVGGTDSGREIVDEDDYTGAPGTTTEDLCDDGGGVPGGMPQTAFGNPPGWLSVIETAGPPSSWVAQRVDLVGFADRYADDPEPEFVDINHRNQAVVTLQENNHVVVVDLASRTVVHDFPAGTVTLSGVDAQEDGVIELTDTLTDVLREPDGVAWIGTGRIATANEGDLDGGSRGFSIFDVALGEPVHDSGTSLERIAVRHGHYPEDRSENKGAEPESIATAKYGPNDFLFVGSERGSFVAVYRLDPNGLPAFSQLLPAPLGPEGLLPIPHRNLLVASGEVDDPEFGVRSTVMIYQLQRGAPTYPQVLSANDPSTGVPIAWSALSGLTEIPGVDGKVQAVWDSYYSQSRVFTIDVTQSPAVITSALTITGGGNYDPEGLAYAPDGSLWIASEGDASDSRPNLLLRVNPATGAVLEEIGLPAEVLACRQAERTKPAPRTTGTFGSGFEGLDVVADGDDYKVYVAQQRGWNYSTAGCEALDDDLNDSNPAEPSRTRIWIYDPQTRTWDHVAWQLAPRPANTTWVGLSEITRVDGGWILLERDNRTGDFGVLKTLVFVSDAGLSDGEVTSGDKAVYDLRPWLAATNGWITDKPEGVAVLQDGRAFVVTDNDGVEDWSGETWFFGLGPYWTLFP